VTSKGEASYVPALAYRVLTPLYDPLIAATTRERTFKSALASAADVRAGMRVLDVGCGTGTLAIRIKAGEPGATVVGIDGDPAMLARATAKARRDGKDVAFQEALSFALPFEPASFDRVVSSLFFHHLVRGDKERTLAEIHRVLVPGGELHIADWGLPRDRLTALLSKGIARLDGYEQTIDNLSGRLPGLIESAGFDEVRMGPAFRTPFGLLELLRARRPD
jgi:ubiquinone/menaquinone biosynthesis C-methylase UbiE